MSQWIWKFGEFEIYHNMLLHNRRQQYGYLEPAVWKIYAPDPVVRFCKSFTTKGGVIKITACGDFSANLFELEKKDHQKYGGRREIPVEAGTYALEIRVSNLQTFPSLYVEGVVESDETWLADDLTMELKPVGTWDAYYQKEITPEKFPFAYEKIAWKKREVLEDGVLFDFGTETFAETVFSGLAEKPVRVQFGESREEALDEKWSVIHFEQEPEKGRLSYPPYAFRYLFVSDPNAQVKANYEYLPLKQKGTFSCDEEMINRVWDTAAYTFHLNSREFLLDGIKRDRWVWSADAYQSLFVNRYLFLDQELEKRTLTVLGGKSPFKRHINTIVDYTFFWIISLYDYYQTYGDLKFLHQIFEQMQEVMRFCQKRTDEDGFMRGKEGDWIFIDWAEIDKTGALCGEQILYAKAMKCYAAICTLLGKEDDGCTEKAECLTKQIFDHFYDKEMGVFIDSYESGKRNVTRHCNILAYLFLPCSQEQKQQIYERVILNDNVAAITTPYFKFYENQVHCEAGNGKLLEKSLREYYGCMLEQGATTLYEEYDPKMKGVEHYAMYGNPYEKSLCHAWSASPIYLLGRYRMGVRNTGTGYDSFEVCPQIGGFQSFAGIVPLPKGEVFVSVDQEKVTVKASVPGGVLRLDGREYLLEPEKEICVNRKNQ